MTTTTTKTKEKKQVALVSVFAAIFITIFKFIIGVITGSLGILSEALHSGLDLVAAVITKNEQHQPRVLDFYISWRRGKVFLTSTNQ